MKGYRVSYSSGSGTTCTSDSTTVSKSGSDNVNSEVSKTNQQTVHADIIRDRCRIAIAGRGNMVSVEGHADKNRLRK